MGETILNSVLELISVLNQHIDKNGDNDTVCVIDKASEVKLLKKNRTTKVKLEEEFPNIQSITKYQGYELYLGKTFEELCERLNIEQEDETKECTSAKKEFPYNFLHKNILQHKITNKLYFYAGLKCKQDPRYTITCKDGSLTYHNEEDKYDKFDYINQNYGPSPKTSNVDIQMLVFSLDAIDSIMIDGEIVYTLGNMVE